MKGRRGQGQQGQWTMITVGEDRKTSSGIGCLEADGCTVETSVDRQWVAARKGVEAGVGAEAGSRAGARSGMGMIRAGGEGIVIGGGATLKVATAQHGSTRGGGQEIHVRVELA